MKIIVTGVPGVGKSSVVKGLVEDGWRLIGFGTIMLEIAKEKHGINDRDEMRRKLKVSEYREVQIAAAKKIAEMDGKVLVDTHASIINSGWYYPGLPMNQLLSLKADGILVVEADPKELQLRRKKDAGIRKRDEFPFEMQDINRYFVSAYSAISGAPVFFIKNREGKLEDSIEAVKKACESL
ncbi:MAG: adenylate kinase [Candidatus Altiarchaeota archaeon]|nr:adenylate kinase [Candidatus Altiarchaeota archaeon]